MALFITSCASTHKITQESHAKVDSVAHVVSDSLSVTKSDTQNSSFTASGITVDINYDSTDASQDTTGVSTVGSPVQDNGPQDPFATIIKDAVAASGKTGKLASIHIHVDNLKDTTSHVTDTTSKQTHVDAKTSVKSNVSASTVTKTTTGLSGWISAVIGIILLGGVVSVGVWFFKKFKLV